MVGDLGKKGVPHDHVGCLNTLLGGRIMFLSLYKKMYGKNVSSLVNIRPQREKVIVLQNKFISLVWSECFV